MPISGLFVSSAALALASTAHGQMVEAPVHSNTVIGHQALGSSYFASNRTNGIDTETNDFARPSVGCSADALPAADRRRMEQEYARRLRADGKASADAWVAEQGRLFRIKLVADGICPAGIAPSAHAPKKCSSGSQIAGGAIGGAIGGALGNQVSGRKNRALGTIIGLLGGMVVGSMIARQLDACEKEKMDEATIKAVNAPTTDAPQSWTSDSRENVRGTVTAAAPVTLGDGRQCRTVTRVGYISGREVRETPRLCRSPPGNEWQVA